MRLPFNLSDFDRMVRFKAARLRPHGSHRRDDMNYDTARYLLANYTPEDVALVLADCINAKVLRAATAGANKVLREIGRTGQWPADWDAHVDGAAAISISGRQIRLAEATAADLAEWEYLQQTRHYKAKRRLDHVSRGALWASAEITRTQASNFHDAIDRSRARPRRRRGDAAA